MRVPCRSFSCFSGGSHNEYYDFGMIDTCASFIEEGRVQFFTLSLIVRAGLLLWKNGHDQAECTVPMNDMSLKPCFIPFYHIKTGWFDGMMATGCPWSHHASSTFSHNI